MYVHLVCDQFASKWPNRNPNKQMNTHKKNELNSSSLIENSITPIWSLDVELWSHSKKKKNSGKDITISTKPDRTGPYEAPQVFFCPFGYYQLIKFSDWGKKMCK